MLRKLVISFVLISMLFSFPGYKLNAAVNCLTLTPSSSDTDKNYCKQELVQIEAQLQELLVKQAEQQKNTGTLTGDVKYLTSQINALKTKITARSLAIAQLKVSITKKSSKITTLLQQIDSQHQSIAQLLRNTNDLDNESFVNLVLANQDISSFYADVESYASIKKSIQDSIDQIRGIKSQTEAEKIALQQQQNSETDAKSELESAQAKVAKSELDKQQLLSISKQKEASYKALAAQKKAQADKIRAALFPLAGTSQKIDFGTALRYANEAKTKTGIDPAFLLAIVTQESNLGANVGQCYLTDPTTGAGKGKNTGTPFVNVMKPTRDVPPFLAITSALGFNAFQTPVSCPIAGVAGWGGAMGPAQFIASTWQLFAARLQSALGHYANPWAAEDAFMASSMYLTDLGGVGTSASAQNNAACKYYGSGGGNCYYSKSVQTLRANIQADIDLLNNQ